jgi:hypothetical protein
VSTIVRKFWIDSRGHRWVAYCAGDVMVALTREELDAQEIAA